MSVGIEELSDIISEKSNNAPIFALKKSWEPCGTRGFGKNQLWNT